MSKLHNSLRASVAALAIAAGSICIASPAVADTVITLPAASLEDSLNALSRNTGVQILVDQALLVGKKTGAVSDAHSPEAALGQLLRGSGLRYEKRGGAFLVVRAAKPVAPAVRESVAPIATSVGTPPVASANPGDEVEAIVVTGSRVARREFATPMPITVVGMDNSARLGRTTGYDALRDIPSVGVGIGPSSSFGQSYDSGVASVSLRNLGANRTLTLIDGMRRVSGSAQSSAVDLNMIPAGMIDRIEVVTGGAAAVYGADAVTGAVNVITKRNFSGLEISAQKGISTYGDMSRTTISAVAGGKFADDRGSFIMGATYYKSPELAAADRKSAQNFAVALANPKNTGPNDGIPDQIIVRDWTGLYISPVPTFFYNGNTYLVRNGGVSIGKYATQYTTGEFSGGVGGDGYPNNSTRNYYINESIESFSTIAKMNYKLTDAIEYTARVDYGRTKSINRKEVYRDDSRTVFVAGAGGSVAYLDNPYLPSALRQFMTSNGLTKLSIDRAYTNVPQKVETHDRNTLNLYNSLGGPLGIGDLKWEAYYQRGRTEDNINYKNFLNLSHWKAARDAIADPVTGTPICRDAAARAAGCVPFNIFGVDQLTPAQLAYVSTPSYERRVNTQDLAGASLAGTLMRLPYGDLSFSLGAEHREESLKTKNSAIADAANLVWQGQLDSHPEIDADMKVSEVFGELVAPILRDVPFARKLEAEGAYRYSDYDKFGSTSAWKGGVTWSPFRGLSLRGVRSRSVRVPNFYELYSPVAISATASLVDPCGAGRYSQTATRAANCAALGITTPLPSIYPDGILVYSGGNPNLKPEKSDSLTFGAILQPQFIPNLNITVDYWRIGIKNVITQYSTLDTMNLCVDLPTIDNPYCRQVDRGADGKVTAIRTNQINAAKLFARGIDFGVDYRHALGAGRVGLAFNGTYLLDYISHSTPGIATGDIKQDGGYANPRFKGTLTLSYDIAQLSVALETRYMSPSLYYQNNVSDEFVDDNHIPSRTYNDLSINYSFPGNVTLGVGVNNAFNVKPPYWPGLTIGGSGLYDVIGRYMFVTAKKKF